MSEKVRLPKDVCDALDYAINETEMTNTQIVKAIYHKAHAFDELEILNEQNADLIMRALVLGYEPELSPEEQLKENYLNPPLIYSGQYKGYRDGIKQALFVHGIIYDWMGDAE